MVIEGDKLFPALSLVNIIFTVIKHHSELLNIMGCFNNPWWHHLITVITVCEGLRMDGVWMHAEMCGIKINARPLCAFRQGKRFSQDTSQQ